MCVCLHGHDFVVGVCRGGFCEKQPKGFPVSDRANANQLQDGPTTDLGSPHQQCGCASGIMCFQKGRGAAEYYHWKKKKPAAKLFKMDEKN